MKRLRFLMMSFSQNIVSSVIMLIILSVALVAVQNVIGQYRYITYSRYIIENEYLQNSDYFMAEPDLIFGDDGAGFSDRKKNIKKIQDKILSLDGVEDIARYEVGVAEFRSKDVNVALYNDAMQKAFSKQLSEGVWFEQADKSSDLPNVVVGGAAYNDIPVGSDISINLYGNTENPDRVEQKVHIIGKIGYPWYTAVYSVGSDEVSTKDFLIQADIMIFDNDDVQTNKKIRKHSSLAFMSMMYFVVYSSDCTAEQKEAVRDYYSSVGTYASYDKILENTNKLIHEDLMNKIVIPIYLLTIATITLISISTLNTYKKLKDHSVYYLCGCSRKKSFAYLFAEISLVAVIATIINIIYVTITINNLTSGNMGYSECIIDYKNVLFSVIYCIVTIAITVILPFIVYKKNTPLEVYRRNHND